MPKDFAPAPIHYRVEVADLNAHLFRVTLTVAHPQAQQRVSLPAWIPGSYLVREFSKNLQRLQARQGGKPVALQQLDKCSWQVDCTTQELLVLSYEVYAFDNSVRAAWLDATRGFFNGTSLCLRVEGQEDSAHELELVASRAVAHWSVATGLSPLKVNRRGFGNYRATDYDELVDSPVEMGNFWSGAFTAGGVPHRFVVTGVPPSFDGERLLADTRKICEAEIRLWHSPSTGRRHKAPHRDYLFLLNATDDGYGGLEHRNSTALICARRDLPRLGAKPADGYTTLLGLISHEYFHTWNVKRLRPTEFARYDYTQENYTQLLWFFEGFTSYYDDLLLRRAGLLDDAGYLKLLNKTINQVMQTPGRAVQSVAQASFDAWVKYYRQDENTPNATVSYYSKGALVALCLDLSLRADGSHTLDEVMRALWQRCQGGPMSEGDLLQVLQDIAGRSYAREIKRWVHSTAELPLKELLERHGVVIQEEPAQLAQQLGLRVTEGAAIQIKTVLRGGAAEQAGFAAGDEWLGIEVGAGKNRSGWRLTKLDDLPLYAGPHSKVDALVARDKRLLKLPLKLPRAVTTWRLSVRDKPLIEAWLAA
ncbi:MAG: peptidase M61 [Hylemonella sp.]|nr:peptidase M61 [Hylemonella sp.]MDP1937891.1 peptidase M61 [Hylemonella sp.]